MSLERSQYVKEKLVKLSLSGETLNSVLFEDCLFELCSLVNCKLVKVRFINCQFKDCLLSGVVPMDSRFLEVAFRGSKVNAVDWTKTQEIRDLSFQDCQVNFSNFRFLKLEGLKMTRCQVKDSDFVESDLSGADFKYSDLENSLFFKTNLTSADFKGAVNYHIDVRQNTLEKARFSLPEALVLLNSLDIIVE
jgi:fluoroquinolone resistance protein